MSTVLKRKPELAATPHTPELGQHHEVEAPSKKSPHHRIKSRLDRLLDDHEISAAEWNAGIDYRDDYERGEEGSNSRDDSGVRGGDGCPVTFRLDAVRRLANARANLTIVQRVAMDYLSRDRPWIEVGRKLYPKAAARLATTQMQAELPDAAQVKLRSRAKRLNASLCGSAKGAAIAALRLLARHYGHYGTGSRVRAAAVVVAP